MNAPVATSFDLDAAPISVREVTLAVRYLEAATAFYRDVLGLVIHAQSDTHAVLGAEVPFLTLAAAPDATPARPDAPGLFHVAFRFPTRVHLASWLAHAASLGVRPLGASDHNVSEAIYLADPEGNGIEVYADRPIERWTDAVGALYMPSHRLDLSCLPAPERWKAASEGTRIGHVHLQTTGISAAEGFWTGLGFEVTARYPGASFFGSGGYHHQIAANVWNSRGQPMQQGPKTGLTHVALSADPALVAAPTSHVAPSGVTISLHPKGT